MPDRGNATRAPRRARSDLVALLAAEGFVAADDEAGELLAAAGGDSPALERMLARRLTGEPLAWITGRARLDGLEVGVDPGVYVPRAQSAALVRRAAARLPERGAALDLCTGSGVVALALQRARPAARVVATDSDRRAVTCARRNGVDARLGDLFEPAPDEFAGTTDVVVAVAPYVPSDALHLLPRDTLRHEDVAHYDGGREGTAILARVIAGATRYLRPGGALLLELGGDQAEAVHPLLVRCGYRAVDPWSDEDGDRRGLEATMGLTAGR